MENIKVKRWATMNGQRIGPQQETEVSIHQGFSEAPRKAQFAAIGDAFMEDLIDRLWFEWEEEEIHAQLDTKI